MPRYTRKRRQLKEEATGKKRRLFHQEHCPVAPSVPGGKERAFACPFGLLAPNRYPMCAVHAGHGTVSYLKQHLERAHKKSDLECPRCHEHWKETKKGSNEEHANHLRAGKCELRSEIDPLIPEELKRLAAGLESKDQSGVNQVQKWNWIWDTFFAGHSRPGSPFAEKFGGFLDTLKPVIKALFVLQPALRSGQADELIEALKEHLCDKPEPFRRSVPHDPSTAQVVSLQGHDAPYPMTDGAGDRAQEAQDFQWATLNQLDGQPGYQNLPCPENAAGVQIDGAFSPTSQSEPTSPVEDTELDPTLQLLPTSTATAGPVLDDTNLWLGPWVLYPFNA
ncbi:hypothetical protein B0T10DRAFT_547219 [Thelonectria olida]|uniref:C2H2-type domain-containing protein n=1 Tax=Thelonectria olida TaxID=1576542 RepID=A0A9P8WAK7_9HYPO|nr:hypothetical protein B0T10DRAFT_547219 [Thelonectria olida]